MKSLAVATIRERIGVIAAPVIRKNAETAVPIVREWVARVQTPRDRPAVSTVQKHSQKLLGDG
jgi:hypothetical protein